MQDEKIFSVTALTEAIKNRLENAFPLVWVRGQVTDLSRPASGHLYFALRDETSRIAAVWFKKDIKSEERFDPLTGEVYADGPRLSLASRLENGQEILCAGRLALYKARGIYQLVLEYASLAGIGNLHAEFERLRAKLAGLGYFSPDRKRPLPPHPKRAALVTSPQGAAVQDFLRLSEKRGLGSAFRLYPVSVQGDEAGPKIAATLRRIGEEGWAEVIVLIRGGGSLEDLWAFNDETLAQAVFASPVPVLAGIGHEIDFTLTDMTADLRAATPSHAAQLLLPDRAELAAALSRANAALRLNAHRRLEDGAIRFENLEKTLARLSPFRMLANRDSRLETEIRLLRKAGAAMLKTREQRLDMALRTLQDSGKLTADKAERRLEVAGLRLEALNPRAPLERGYALARKADGSFLRSRAEVSPGQALTLTVLDGDVAVRVEDRHVGQ
ncbi:MAG: exodeoxyribonuclease VII large subunit [Desulfovibrio sp.]|jgi:exodeoxyribonuclease VII large subunit|nr:exodeoxyribonuclease VII large subunit [Desulfovibrio sp.]